MIDSFISLLGLDGSTYPELFFIFKSIVGVFIIWESFQLIKYVFGVLINFMSAVSR